MRMPQNASSRGVRVLREKCVQATVAVAKTIITSGQTSIRSIGKGEGNTMLKGPPAYAVTTKQNEAARAATVGQGICEALPPLVVTVLLMRGTG